MNKNVKGAIAVGVVLAIGYGFYYLKMSKTAYAKTISKLTKTDWRNYMGMDKPFLKARANAVKSSEKYFYYQGEKYLTENGRTLSTAYETK